MFDIKTNYAVYSPVNNCQSTVCFVLVRNSHNENLEITNNLHKMSEGGKGKLLTRIFYQ